MMITLPITEQAKQQDWNFILTMGKINGYSQSEKDTMGHPHLPQSTYT